MQGQVHWHIFTICLKKKLLHGQESTSDTGRQQLKKMSMHWPKERPESQGEEMCSAACKRG
jgi:hypothetical protein